MKVSVIKTSELDRDLENRWEEIRSQNSDLVSPYFTAEFTKQVGKCRPQVYVGVLEENGDIIGFFPFQKNIVGTGRPVGGALSDYHGLISMKSVPGITEKVIQQTGLKVWKFDHLIASQSASLTQEISPSIYLPKGFTHYLEEMKKKVSRQYTKIQRMRGKLEREVAPLRFEFQSNDQKALQKVFEWKGAQCRRTGGIDFFQYQWIRSLIENIFSSHTSRFKGVLSTLYAGDRLIAAHFGIQSDHVLHYWFPVYDVALKKYSPGISLLFYMLEEAENHHISLVDLGKGKQRYKTSFMNHQTLISEGEIVVSPFFSMVRSFTQKVRHVEHAGLFGKALNLPGRALRKWDRFIKFR